MPQLQLPIFPPNVTEITEYISFAKRDNVVTYFRGPHPIFQHEADDVATFRMITAQFCVNGFARQSDIVRAFGVSTISMKRSVKLYREKGPKGFYKSPPARREPRLLVDALVGEIESLLAEGMSDRAVAETLKIKVNTLQRAIREGRIQRPLKKSLNIRR